MTTALGHRVILASAGSGKTFQLSSRYIALLARGVPPERILATTFTRRAAGEILGRVLARLAAAASDPHELARLDEQLEGVTLDGPACRALLARLLRGLHRFRAGTLDAFFVELATLFGLEGGLAPGWRIAERHDEIQLRESAVGRALADASRDELLPLLRELKRHPARSPVHRTLLELAERLHGVYRDSPAAAWDAIRPPAPPPDAELQAALDAARALPIPLTGKGTPVQNWVKARGKLLTCLDEDDWEALLESTLLLRAACGEPKFSSHEIPDGARRTLTVLAGQAAHRLFARLARSNRASRRLVERYDAAHARCRAERAVLGFDEFPRALLAAREHGALDEAGARHRLDGAVDHLLLDEFQDTSPLQWRALGLLAAPILACADGSRTLFCVGDVKQSIYGWREGEPRLLAEFARRHPQVQEGRLTTSWRSSPMVLAAVNAVFEGLPARAALAGDAAAATAATTFAASFEPHAAAARHADLPGCVTLREVEGKTADVLAAAAAHVARLCERAPARRIAVLVRSNRTAASMIYRLRTHHGLRASGEGGNALVDSEAVQLALSLLHLADHPDDGAARFHLEHSALGAALGLPEVASARLAADTRSALLALGYGRWLAGLQRHVDAAPAFDAWERRRFGQLVELGFAWEPHATLRPGDFVASVRSQRVEDPLGARLVVMTVHGSKGLEFDAVVLPDLDGPLAGARSPALLTCRPDAEGPITQVFPGVSRDAAALHEPVARLSAAVRQRRIEEELCVLYVAMTRAIRRLDLFIAGPAPKETSCTPAALLREALHDVREPPSGVEPGGADGEPRWLHLQGDNAGWAGADVAATVPADGRLVARAALPQPLRFAAPGRRRALRRRTPSGREGGRLVLADRLLQGGGRLERGRGLLVHLWLQQVEWIERFEGEHAGDEALLALGRRATREQALGLDDAALRAELQRFRERLARPAVRAALSRPDGEPVLWRERRFVVPIEEPGSGAAGLLRGAFDRVILEPAAAGGRNAGAFAAATIVDFKTDAVTGGAELAARAADYAPQMAEYRRALAVLTGLPPAAIRCTLLFLEADAAVDVPPEADG